MAQIDYKTVAVLGDSISNGYFDEEGLGWIARFSRKLNTEKPNGFFFCNHAVAGDRICDVYHRLGALVAKNEPDIIFIAVGVNDTYRFGTRDAAPAMAIELRRAYWTRTLDAALHLTPRVYVFLPLPVEESRVPARTDDFGVPMFYRNDDVKAYGAEIRGWAQARNVRVLDFHESFAGHTARFADDVHPAAEGHEYLAQLAFDALHGEFSK